MVGNGLKKMAKEAGLNIDKGVAYGEYMGYSVTMWEGNGYKGLGVSARCTDESRLSAFLQQFDNKEMRKKYRIDQVHAWVEGMQIIFNDAPGTMKRYREFTEWLLPQLSLYGFLNSAYCPMCGLLLDGASSWRLDKLAVHGHDRCFASREQEEKAEVERIKNEDTGSYASGFLGAVLGALLGAIPWAIALFMGYIASVLGFLISLLSAKGYDLLHGKMGKGKLFIVTLVSAVGVVCGNILGDVISIAVMIGKGELFGASFADIPAIMAELFRDAEYMDMFQTNLKLGLFFALLGIAGVVWKMYKENPTRVVSSKKLKG